MEGNVNATTGGNGNWVNIAITVCIAVVVAWGLLRLNKLFFKRIQVKHNGLHLLFFKRLVDVLIIIACVIITISAFVGIESIWKTILGGTAITSAVLTFAAQDIIKDVLGGLMISINKPFEIGNRIETEDGTIGIVEDMTPRHVVLRGIDTLRHVVPNSKLNTMRVINYSYQRKDRAISFTFPVGYESDMELVKRVIAKEVEESPYTKPKLHEADGTESYGPVRFLEIADSALIMGVTVYYDASNPTENVKDDINSRVMRALAENHIDVPYPHITVQKKKEGMTYEEAPIREIV